MKLIAKPASGEFAPYTSIYIDLLPNDGRILQHLATNLQNSSTFFRSIPPEKLTTPHRQGEWTVQEILLHIIDDERIFAYRALRFARGDTTTLPGFEQDDYILPSRANQRSLDSLLTEFGIVRQATLSLYNSFGQDVLTNTGVASNNPMSVRAIAYHIAGHELHHIASIRENYLSSGVDII